MIQAKTVYWIVSKDSRMVFRLFFYVLREMANKITIKLTRARF